MSTNKYGPNIIYITTSCNFKCQYCYEEEDRNKLETQKTLSKKEIDDTLYKIIEREPKDRQTIIIIFGGEPLLYPELVEYTIMKALSIKQKTAFDIITNGSLVIKHLDKLEKWKQYCNNNGSFFGIEISHDGSGMDLRKYRSGKSSTIDVNKTLYILNKRNIIPFKISYTINPLNYNNISKDIIELCERYINVSRISVYCAYNLFDDNSIDNIHLDFKKNYAPYIYSIYKKPLCNTDICHLCRKCDKSADNYYYKIPGVDEIQSYNKHKMTTFQGWDNG